MLRNMLKFWYFRIFKKKYFIFCGKKFKNYQSFYNYTFENERAIEIPIVMSLINANINSNNILELGNVLSHYFNFKHDIVDKYEISDGVINEDILEYNTSQKYNVIVSISTIEHIGWDEKMINDFDVIDDKIIRVIEKLKQMLKQDGMIIITVPIGFNKVLDNMIFKETNIWQKFYCFKKINNSNEWIQVSLKDLYGCRYNSPYKAASGLFISIMKNNS